MSRDLVTRPYGRFFYLPKYLADRGHDVSLLLLDYRNSESVDMHRDGIYWLSESLLNRNPAAYFRKLDQYCSSFRPDWIIGFSDTYYGILAQRYAQKYGARSCIDAYDNFESYIPWMMPLHRLWRKSLMKADLVTAAGPGLADLMSVNRNCHPARVIPMAADPYPAGFRSMDRLACRRQLDLPRDKKIIGYCGSTHKSRGLHVLFDAIEMVQEKHPDVGLLLSGRSWKNIAIPELACHVGYIADEKMPVLLNSMDVLTVINRTTSFGNFSYPVKLYEAMSCSVPVIATETPATRWILSDHPDCLVRPSDPDALCNKIEQSLGLGRINYSDVPDWRSNAGLLEQLLL